MLADIFQEVANLLDDVGELGHCLGNGPAHTL